MEKSEKMEKPACFKAYQVNGVVPSELNAELAYDIGRAYAKLIDPDIVIIGFDVRKSSEALCEALVRGLNNCGVDVINIGLCGTEMVYYAVGALEADGGIMITAGSNPPEYNGMKFVTKDSVPMGYETGLKEIENMIVNNEIGEHSEPAGDTSRKNVMSGFINLGKFYNPEKIKHYKIVVNAGNGCAGLVLDALERHLPVKMIKINNEPNSGFPHGIPNPRFVDKRQETVSAILDNQADFGVAWDVDYDRCFFFDEKGNFIEGDYITGLLSKSILKRYPVEKIVFGAISSYNIAEVIKKAGGYPVQLSGTDTTIRQLIRDINAVFGGEADDKYYFRDASYSASGMIPFLLILQLLSDENKPLSHLVQEIYGNLILL